MSPPFTLREGLLTSRCTGSVGPAGANRDRQRDRQRVGFTKSEFLDVDDVRESYHARPTDSRTGDASPSYDETAIVFQITKERTDIDEKASDYRPTNGGGG